MERVSSKGHRQCAGIILAYSNSVAGRLSDITVRANIGNIGCFFGGTAATLLSGALTSPRVCLSKAQVPEESGTVCVPFFIANVYT